jgi:hypothetical protein
MGQERRELEAEATVPAPIEKKDFTGFTKSGKLRPSG